MVAGGYIHEFSPLGPSCVAVFTLKISLMLSAGAIRLSIDAIRLSADSLIAFSNLLIEFLLSFRVSKSWVLLLLSAVLQGSFRLRP